MTGKLPIPHEKHTINSLLPTESGPKHKGSGNFLTLILAALTALGLGMGLSHYRALHKSSDRTANLQLKPVTAHSCEPTADTPRAPATDHPPFESAKEQKRVRQILDRQAGLPTQPVNGSGYVEPLEIDDGAIQLEMVWIPPGTFTMGSDEGHGDEQPAHTVEISRGFWISKFEVTQAQYEAVMKRNLSFSKGGNLPVERLSWQDCGEFTAKLSGATGRTYRLPTEAQWEYACRTASSSRYCLGNGFERLPQSAWYKTNAGTGSHPVGLKEPNAWGIHDMHGNVAEWCLDWYHSDYYKTSPEHDPRGPLQPEIIDLRVIRGGAWNMLAPALRSSFRYALSYQYGNRYTGLRLVAETAAGGNRQ